MNQTTLGRTGLSVSRTGFGCLPIQRISQEESAALLLHAVDSGITFFDTARAYTDSEAKIGMALSGVRDKIIIATKTHAKDAETFWQHLHESLAALGTDHIDIYQFHMPPFVPVPGGADGLYDAALEARDKGLIRFIGITQHSLELAEEAVRSSLYDTLQYPFNHLATDEEIALVKRTQDANIGFICMKALSGGLITDATIPFAFLRDYEGAVPIWGFQRMEELLQVLALEENPPAKTEALLAQMEADKQALSGAFCRACGYCLPCPVQIPIQNANRMQQLLTRSPAAQWLTDTWREGMERIADCTRCGICAKRCPYNLKPYETLPAQLAFYREFIAKNA